jgi:AcrR family transcriptional regulator
MHTYNLNDCINQLVKPGVQTMPETPPAGLQTGAAAPLRILADADLGETKAKILDAAFRRLAQEGYAALSVREIAKDAGVNHALINYHFRTRDQLVIAVLDAANRRLLERQTSMYREPGGFAEKWAQAGGYEADRAGFVRAAEHGPRACRTGPATVPAAPLAGRSLGRPGALAMPKPGREAPSAPPVIAR